MLPARLNSLPARPIGQLALAGLVLFLLLSATLQIVRNGVENLLVQKAAQDLPLLKNRWPQFKKAIEELHDPITKSLAQPGKLEISSPIPELLHQITDAHSFSTIGKGDSLSSIQAHIEIIFFERGSVTPTKWYWSPSVDTSLAATELHTRVSLQQLEQTEVITENGLVSEPSTPDSLINQRRALVFFYLNSEWDHRESLIKALVRAVQIAAVLTILLITLWVFLSTHKLHFTLMIPVMSVLGLIIYSSYLLKALSLRTVLTMLITIQFGPDANRASDFAGFGLLAGCCYGLILLGLLHLPTQPSCPQCQRNVSDDYRFCPHCNFVLKRNCSRCAEPVDTRWNYCPSCSEDI